MSIRITSEVWQNAPVGGTELLCLLALADFANDAGEAYPSIATLAGKLRMSERNTQYLLKKLEAQGLLRILRSTGPKGCNLYQVQTSHTAKAAPVQSVACEGAMGSVKPVQTPAPKPSLNHQEPSSTRKPPAGFEAFWASYPRKKSKGDAEKAWKALKPDDALAGAIVQAVAHAAESEDWRKDGGRYVPYPATWLRAKGWMDEGDGDASLLPVWER